MVSKMSFSDFVSEFCVDFDPMVCSIVMEQFSCDMCMTYKIVVKLALDTNYQVIHFVNLWLVVFVQKKYCQKIFMKQFSS